MQYHRFTVLDLVVIFFSIGVLALVLMFYSKGVGNTADNKITVTDLSNMRTEAQLYFNEHGGSFGGAYSGACPSLSNPGNGGLFYDLRIKQIIAHAVHVHDTDQVEYSDTVCVVNPDGLSWATAVVLKGAQGGDTKPDVWCVDSSNASVAYTYSTDESLVDSVIPGFVVKCKQ